MRAVRRCIALVLTAGLAAGGCDNTVHPEFVAKRWSDTLKAFNIEAIFPPRYVQVGDIFLFLLPSGTEATSDLYTRRALRLGRAEVRGMLMDDMRADLLLPTTETKDPDINIFNVPREIDRLNLAAFPGFNIAQVTEGELGISLPVQAFRAVFGGVSSHDLAVSISIPQAEDSELPAYDAYRALVSYCAPAPGVRRCDVRAPEMNFFVRNLCPVGEVSNTVLTPWVVFVNHVYYARQINYAYTPKGGEALGISAAVAATSAASAATKTDTSKSSPSGSTSDNSEHLTDAEKEVQALQSRIDALEGQLGVTGGRLQVLAANSQGTFLSQTFNSPIAIGYRGLWSNAGPPGTYCDLSSDRPDHASPQPLK